MELGRFDPECHVKDDNFLASTVTLNLESEGSFSDQNTSTSLLELRESTPEAGTIKSEQETSMKIEPESSQLDPPSLDPKPSEQNTFQSEPITSKSEEVSCTSDTKTSQPESRASHSETDVHKSASGACQSGSEPSFVEDASKYEACDSKSESSASKSATGASKPGAYSSKSDGFLLETKYMLLNFMNLLPPDLYADHLVCSPVSASTDRSVTDQFWMRPASKLSKSSSCDVASISSRPPKLKYLSNLSAFQSLNKSPASEDNVNYRYDQNLHKQESIHSLPLEPDSPTRFAKFDMTKATSTSSANSPMSPISPRKTPQLLYRLGSDVSSGGDSSYNWDADDEYELSNASSLLSMCSVSIQDGFLDLRRSSPWTPALSRQSDVEYKLSEEDEIDGDLPMTLDDINVEVEELPLVRDKAYCPHQTSHHDTNIDCGLDCCININKADRSRLKLNIPSHSVQLDDTLGSLKTELDSKMSDIESQFEEAMKVGIAARISPPPRAHAEVARMLARIGDEVMVEHGPQISQVMEQLVELIGDANQLTYRDYWATCNTVVEQLTLPGWRQVAMLMVIGQRTMWHACQHGREQLSNLVDYAAQVVTDVAADFIIKEGGWGAIMNVDPSQSSDSSASADNYSHRTLDYFTEHNITQVHSGTHTDLNQNSPQTDNVNMTSPWNTCTDDKSNIKPCLTTEFEATEGSNTELDKQSELCYTNTSSISLNSPSTESLSPDETVDLRPNPGFGMAQGSVPEVSIVTEYSPQVSSSLNLYSSDSLSIDNRTDHRPSLGFEITQGSNPELEKLPENRFSIGVISDIGDYAVFDDVCTKDKDAQTAVESIPVISDYGEIDLDFIINPEDSVDISTETITTCVDGDNELNQTNSVWESSVDVIAEEQTIIQLQNDELSNNMSSNTVNHINEECIDNPFGKAPSLCDEQVECSSNGMQDTIFPNSSNNAISIDPNSMNWLHLPNGNTATQFTMPNKGTIHSNPDAITSICMTDDEKEAISDTSNATTVTILENTKAEVKGESEVVDTYTCDAETEDLSSTKEKNDVIGNSEADNCDNNGTIININGKEHTNESPIGVLKKSGICKMNYSAVKPLGSSELLDDISDNNNVSPEFSGTCDENQQIIENQADNGINEHLFKESTEVIKINDSNNATQETECHTQFVDENILGDMFHQIRRMGIRVVAVTLGVLVVGIGLKIAFIGRRS